MAEGQITITPSGDLEDGIGDCGLKGQAAVVPHAVKPMFRLEEGDVDLGWLFAHPAQREPIEIVFDNAAFVDITLLIQHVV